MSNASWGTKRSCPKCAARFYDLDQHPAQCPKCHHTFDPAAMLKPRRGRARKFSNLTPETEADDALFNSILAKTTVGGKGAKKSKDELDLKDDDDVLVEDAEEIEEFESLQELDGVEDGKEGDDDASEESIMEDFAMEGEELVDSIEEDEEDEDADEEEDKPKKRRR